MDPAIQQLATQVMTILLPLVSIGAEEIARSAGADAYEKAKKLFATLKDWWKGDKEAEENLILFEAKPNRYQTVVEEILKEKLAADQSYVTKISEIIDEFGPVLTVFQRINDSRGITGMKVEQFKSGRGDVQQEITRGQDITGMDIGTVG